MKIIMISPLYDPHIGGVERHVKRVSEELSKKGHEVTIFTLKHHSNLAEFEKQDAITIYRFPKMSLIQIWQWLMNKRQILRNADVIHCHDVTTFLYYYIPFRFLYPTKPVYITFHGFEGIIPIPKSIKFKRKMAEHLTKGNICVGHYISKWYGTRANAIIYGGVDSNIESLSSSDIDSTEKTIDAVFVGRLESDTGILTYIESLRILKEKLGIELELHICGDGTLRNRILALNEKYKLSLQLHGFVDSKPYLQCAKIAFVSGYLSILEAMAAKSLVFSVYGNRLKEDYLRMMPHSNFINISSNAEDIAKSITSYFEDRNSAKKNIIGAYQYAMNQSWNAVADIYLGLWQR